MRTTLDADTGSGVESLLPGERVAMVWALTLDAWASAGRSLPSYARHETPGRMIRRSSDEA